MIEDMVPYVGAFVSALVATLALTPLVRRLCVRLGMVDMPSARRINVRPVPRGGGLALVVGVLAPYFALHALTGRPLMQGISDERASAALALGAAIALVGLADDKWSLRPKVKLACQVAVAFLAWWCAGIGFRGLWPYLPAWIDCILTVCWIVGSVNAFNLIDGLDGLAAGLAVIATFGMAGTLFFERIPQAALLHLAFAGGLLGFLRYNYHPASIFLGDCGSMFIGYTIGVLPLVAQIPDSFTVSVGVPLLAMGVPIFDTALAILRRSIRRLLSRFGQGAGQSGDVMAADTDHLHHRILRAAGLNQRRAAWVLYATALGAVATGLVAMSLQSRSAGLWLVAFAVAAVVMFKDATIEMFDAGLLLGKVAHDQSLDSRRRKAVLSLPFYVLVDSAALASVFFVCLWALRRDLDIRTLRIELPVRVVATFLFLALFRVYRTAWSRALPSNYLRMLVACILGSAAGSVVVYYWPGAMSAHLKAMTLAYAVSTFVALLSVRSARGLVRDLFYMVSCSTLAKRGGVSRVLVYGSGLRYRAFRRELVRSAPANDRIIVGIIDDDIFLRGRYIGGIMVMGTINEAREIVARTKADAVVVACDVSQEWLRVVRGILEPTGVRLTHFTFRETEVPLSGGKTGLHNKRKEKHEEGH